MAEMPYTNEFGPTSEQLGIPTPPRPPVGTATAEAVTPTSVAPTSVPDQMQEVAAPAEQTAVATRDWQAEINDLKSRMEEQKAQYIMQIEMLQAQLKEARSTKAMPTEVASTPQSDIPTVQPQPQVQPQVQQEVMPPRKGPVVDPRPSMPTQTEYDSAWKAAEKGQVAEKGSSNYTNNPQVKALYDKLREQQKIVSNMTPEQRQNYFANRSIRNIIDNTTLNWQEKKQKIRKVKADLKHQKQVEQWKRDKVPPLAIMDRSFNYRVKWAQREGVPQEQIRMMLQAHQHRKKMYRARERGVSPKKLMEMQNRYATKMRNYQIQKHQMELSRTKNQLNKERYKQIYEQWKLQRAEANKLRSSGAK